MFRKSALAMAMLGALTTGNVVALGLGDIELKSALNQPLRAEVELLSATDAELEELKVEMGSPQAFANAGIERPLFLTKLRFNITQNAAGKAVVRISSRDVVREPFLDFLLEVSWSKGRLLREYTVLVDPPVTMPATAPVPQAPAVGSAAPSAQSAPYQPSRRVTHTAQIPPVSAAPGEYGPTKRNDTLWKVAQEVRPDAGVSIEQTMLGLLRANPEAFQGNNINNLKAGYILRVPSREEMTSISKDEAARESRAQYAAWREERALPTPASGQQEIVSETAAPVAGTTAEPSLQLVAPDMAEAGAAAGSAAAGAPLEGLQQELMLANEALEEQRRQGEDMSQRLSVLEEQIANMQRLIQLKDDELARLQSQAGDETAEQPVEAAETLPMEAGETVVAEETVEVPVEAETSELADADVESATGEEVALAEPLDVEGPVDETAASELLTGEADTGEIPAEDLAAAPEAEPVAAEPEPVVSESVVAETYTTLGFVDRLLANPLWLGAGAVVLALLAFFGLRKKRSVETEFQESILQAAQGDSAMPASDSEIVTSQPESRGSTSTESSLLSEFAVSDMGSIKNDGEADPLAEADVYLAYGRYQQAEDLIKDALENDPVREDLNLKLLEVFMAGRNQAAFDEHAQDILARLENSDDPVWEKVAEMGRELSPENPMYQAGAAAPAALDEDAEMDSLSEDMDFTIDEGVEASETAESAEQTVKQTRDTDEGLDFDIDLSFDAAEGASEEAPDSVEFTPPEGFGEQAEISEPELNVDMDSVEPDAVAQANELDFDLEGFELGSEEEVETEPAGDGELADLDEVSTKLDLARAYIDMGDPDGAKSILGEVMEEGSDDQKQEARGIMEQMS